MKWVGKGLNDKTFRCSKVFGLEFKRSVRNRAHGCARHSQEGPTIKANERIADRCFEKQHRFVKANYEKEKSKVNLT